MRCPSQSHGRSCWVHASGGLPAHNTAAAVVVAAAAAAATATCAASKTTAMAALAAWLQSQHE
ncbi:hypothetical protein BM1_06980 [Bipolaris maydis]|nr:hypothetical protein BM1_06980 [Bipolaris maydis]